jgi:hypothetical protein
MRAAALAGLTSCPVGLTEPPIICNEDAFPVVKPILLFAAAMEARLKTHRAPDRHALAYRDMPT